MPRPIVPEKTLLQDVGANHLMLPVHKNLQITGDARKVDAFLTELAGTSMHGWSCDTESETSIAKYGTGNMRCMIRTSESPRLAARLWLARRSPTEVYVSNIVPYISNRLDYTDYNALLDDFAARVVKPISGKHGVVATSTSGEFSLDDAAGKEVADALRTFSSCANKATGSSHPLDQERWFAFVIAAHRTNASLEPVELSRWLAEAEHWDEDVAMDLSIQYEQQRALLEHYDS